MKLAKDFINDKLYKKELTSTLVYGIQWDTTLKFLNDEKYLKDSTGKGWYRDNYKNGNPNHLTGKNVDSNSSNRIKNIYDMAGNVDEWTMETCGVDRIKRGGKYYFSYGNEEPSSERTLQGYGGREWTGFRIVLYLNI